MCVRVCTCVHIMFGSQYQTSREFQQILFHSCCFPPFPSTNCPEKRSSPRSQCTHTHTHTHNSQDTTTPLCQAAKSRYASDSLIKNKTKKILCPSVNSTDAPPVPFKGLKLSFATAPCDTSYSDRLPVQCVTFRRLIKSPTQSDSKVELKPLRM